MADAKDDFMLVRVTYGRQGLALDLPADTYVVEPSDPTGVPDELAAFRAAVREWAQQQVELSRRRYEDPAFIGYIYASIGDKDQAFAWLEKGYKEKSDSIQYLKTIHMADPLRSDPRYADLLKRMGWAL